MTFLRLQVQAVLVVIVVSLERSSSGSPRYFNIGAMLSSPNAEQIFDDAVRNINYNSSLSLNVVRLNSTSYVLNSNPIRSALDVCERVISNHVYVILVSHEKGQKTPPIAVSYACGFYKIPVIGITARESIFSDKTIHESFLRTVPPYSEQADVWVGILSHFKWNKVILLTSNDQDSRAIVTRFTMIAEKNNIKIEKTVMFPMGLTNVTSYLTKVRSSQSRVILFSASGSDAAVVYRYASSLSMLDKGFIWIVTQQAMSGTAKPKVPQGVLGIELAYGDSEETQIKDAVQVAGITLERLVKSGKNISMPPKSCSETATWQSGVDVFKELINTTLPKGLTGEVSFNSIGDRKNTKYNILNKNTQNSNLTVGQFLDGQVSINESIVWPGLQNTMPKGVFVSNHLRVLTLVGEPFVQVKAVPPSGRCQDLDTSKHKHVRCTGRVFGVDIQEDVASRNEHCCYGFCMDLLIRLGEKINFTYSVTLSADGSYGSLRRVNGSDTKRWNGMVGEVIDGKADLIVATLTINNERAEWIEFSKPFKYQGLTILVQKNQSKNSLDSFLRPFQINLWLLVLLSVHIVAVILYLLDRFSPFGRFKLAKKDREETALNLSSAMWFSWGVLLNSGIGEGTPRSFSARVLGMVWAGFAMIIVASYTANLAAFLVLDRPKAVVSGIDDPNLRNPSDQFTYATVANSSVDAYFRRQVELSSMYTFMEQYNVKTDKEGIKKVKNGELSAFIWDSPFLYYEASNDCSLTTAGELFGRSGYGIGMPKGSPWSNEISLAILNFHESGVMEELETTWIDGTKCEEESTSPATLGLSHMLGVFIMVAAGIGAGIIIIILEILYHKHRGWKEEQKELAKKTTDKWRANILMMKKDRTTTQTNGVTLEPRNGQDGTGIARRNPIYSPDNITESAFTYS
ncbi:glutamate receptor ionotropic, NMDA 1-like [Actinia tenebrosa]|uniref:Glutamate [NMDA] receptor subunit 1 n=1 Tax=Actinia tenebrosa TaxID=6105 RepID=A0A6P8HWG3_ACTTE|nr:glutamate receptor ionotropic, NMDA 1-like [Actinia tenebrosa]